MHDLPHVCPAWVGVRACLHVYMCDRFPSLPACTHDLHSRLQAWV